MTSIPVTVFTGFLGAGKTTMILSLLSKLPKDYKIVVLKNEFGDVNVDSALFKLNSIQAVKELVNGCLCCVLVGQMKDALNELKTLYNPNRIIIETSGSAFPAPIAWQIREMAPTFHLDGIITAVDCLNFRGYEDTSYTARLQAQYTDLLVLNKHELISERELDTVIDHVNELNTDTCRVKFDLNLGLNPGLIFGIDTKLFTLDSTTIPSNNTVPPKQEKEEITTFTIQYAPALEITTTQIEKNLKKLSSNERLYRVKGFLHLGPNSWCIINCAFGRCEFTPIDSPPVKATTVAVVGSYLGEADANCLFDYLSMKPDLVEIAWL